MEATRDYIGEDLSPRISFSHSFNSLIDPIQYPYHHHNRHPSLDLEFEFDSRSNLPFDQLYINHHHNPLLDLQFEFNSRSNLPLDPHKLPLDQYKAPLDDNNFFSDYNDNDLSLMLSADQLFCDGKLRLMQQRSSSVINSSLTLSDDVTCDGFADCNELKSSNCRGITSASPNIPDIELKSPNAGKDGELKHELTSPAINYREISEVRLPQSNKNDAKRERKSSSKINQNEEERSLKSRNDEEKSIKCRSELEKPLTKSTNEEDRFPKRKTDAERSIELRKEPELPFPTKTNEEERSCTRNRRREESLTGRKSEEENSPTIRKGEKSPRKKNHEEEKSPTNNNLTVNRKSEGEEDPRYSWLTSRQMMLLASARRKVEEGLMEKHKSIQSKVRPIETRFKEEEEEDSDDDEDEDEEEVREMLMRKFSQSNPRSLSMAMESSKRSSSSSSTLLANRQRKCISLTTSTCASPLSRTFSHPFTTTTTPSSPTSFFSSSKYNSSSSKYGSRLKNFFNLKRLHKLSFMSSPSILTLPGTTPTRSFWPFARNKGPDPDPVRTYSSCPHKSLPHPRTEPSNVLDTSLCPYAKHGSSQQPMTMCTTTFTKDGSSSSSSSSSSSTNDECFSYTVSRDGVSSMTTRGGSSSYSYRYVSSSPATKNQLPSCIATRDGFSSMTTGGGGSSSCSNRYVSSSFATKEQLLSCTTTRDGPRLYATRDCFSSSSPSSITREGSPCNRDRSMPKTRPNSMCIANKDMRTRRSQLQASPNSPKSSSQQCRHNSPVHRFALIAPSPNLRAQKPKDIDMVNLEHQHSPVVQQSKHGNKDKSRMLDVNASLGNNLTNRQGKQGGRKVVNVEKSNNIFGSRGEIPRTKAALERSLAYTSSVRVTPVLNVPSCINPSLRKSKSNSFNFAHLFTKRSISLVPPLKVDIS